MGKSTIIVIYLLVMVATVVITDILFFKHHFWERLIANVGIVLVYVSFYLRFLNRR